MKLLSLFLLVFLAGLALFLPGCDNGSPHPELTLSVSPEAGPVTQTFSVQASIGGIGNDLLSGFTYRWDWENDGIIDTAPSTSNTATHQFTTPGRKLIVCYANHPLGTSLSGGVSVEVTATGNAVPIASFTVSPATGEVGATFNVDASACSDVEDAADQLQVRWDWEDDGTWDTGYSTVKTASHQYTSGGDWDIRCEVKDTAGATASVTRTVRVNNTSINTAPQAYLYATPENGTFSTVFEFDASASTDAEDDNFLLEVRWDWDGNGTWDTPYSQVKTATHQYATAGSWPVKVEVKDTGGLTAVATKTVAVGAAVSNIAQAAYFPGGTVDVQLMIEPPATTTSYTVEDTPPAGWTIYGSISDNGSYNPATGKITWGPFADNQQRTLTYSLLVPAGSSGTKTFSGSAFFNSTKVIITGRRTISKYGGG